MFWTQIISCNKTVNESKNIDFKNNIFIENLLTKVSQLDLYVYINIKVCRKALIGRHMPEAFFFKSSTKLYKSLKY